MPKGNAMPRSPFRSPGEREKDRALKRDALLHAAVRIFNKRGFHAASLDDVAASLGVTKPVVLDLEIAGVTKDPMGSGSRIGATAMGRISRLDYGVGPSSGPMSGMVGMTYPVEIRSPFFVTVPRLGGQSIMT